MQVDNQSSGDTGNLDTQTQDTTSDLTQSTVDSGANEVQAQESKPYQPFSSGKEKFKIDGEDLELDWEESKKYVSMGKTAYKRIQEAAELKQQTQKAYRELLELAQKDPDGLIRALNPNYNPQLQAANPKSGTGQPLQRDQVTDADPRDLELRTVKEELNAMKSMLENQALDQERKVIDQELEQASTKYAVLKNDRFARDYIKQEYRKALQSGMDVTIDDVAFYVAQELQSRNQQKTQEVKQRIEQKRKQAPVNVISAGTTSDQQKPMSLDEVKKLAGRL